MRPPDRGTIFSCYVRIISLQSVGVLVRPVFIEAIVRAVELHISDPVISLDSRALLQTLRNIGINLAEDGNLC